MALQAVLLRYWRALWFNPMGFSAIAILYVNNAFLLSFQYVRSIGLHHKGLGLLSEKSFDVVMGVHVA